MSNSNKKTSAQQAGTKPFLPPKNYSRIPDYIIDEVGPKLSSKARWLLIVIARKTIGWNKATDKISHSQMKKALGTTCQDTVADALRELRGIQLHEGSYYRVGIELIKRDTTEKAKSTITYSLNTDIDPKSVKEMKNHNGVLSQYKAAKKVAEMLGSGVEKLEEFEELEYQNSPESGQDENKEEAASPNSGLELVRISDKMESELVRNSDTQDTSLYTSIDSKNSGDSKASDSKVISVSSDMNIEATRNLAADCDTSLSLLRTKEIKDRVVQEALKLFMATLKNKEKPTAEEYEVFKVADASNRLTGIDTPYAELDARMISVVAVKRERLIAIAEQQYRERLITDAKETVEEAIEAAKPMADLFETSLTNEFYFAQATRKAEKEAIGLQAVSEYREARRLREEALSREIEEDEEDEIEEYDGEIKDEETESTRSEAEVAWRQYMKEREEEKLIAKLTEAAKRCESESFLCDIRSIDMEAKANKPWRNYASRTGRLEPVNK